MSKKNITPKKVTISCDNNVLLVIPLIVTVSKNEEIEWVCTGNQTFEINLESTPFKCKKQISKNKPKKLKTPLNDSDIITYTYTVSCSDKNCKPLLGDEPTITFDN